MADEVLKLILIALCLIGAASVIFATLELHRMLVAQPGVMRRVGIMRIDWWFRCILGVYKLAFGPIARELSFRQKLVFRTLCAINPILILYVVFAPLDWS